MLTGKINGKKLRKINIKAVRGGAHGGVAKHDANANANANANTNAGDRALDTVFNFTSECRLGSEVDGSRVCSPRHMVKKMNEFLESKGEAEGKNLDRPEHTIKNIKTLLDCNSESCIYKKKDFVEFAKLSHVDNFLDKFFKPQGPALSKSEWLSNFNIDDVLDQLQEKYSAKKFYHIPFQMRDFEKIGTELATVDLVQKINEGYRIFGVVLNTDYSTGQGIHWYALCICVHELNAKINKIDIEYFNSSGRPPLAETQAWMQKTRHILEKSLSVPVNVKYTTGIEFQNDNSSCGVFCLAYIWMRLESVPFEWFREDNFTDKMMYEARKNLFRWEK